MDPLRNLSRIIRRVLPDSQSLISEHVSKVHLLPNTVRITVGHTLIANGNCTETLGIIEPSLKTELLRVSGITGQCKSAAQLQQRQDTRILTAR